MAGNNIWERLDRWVANQEWWNLFNDYSVQHLQHGLSDHCPVLVDTRGDESLQSDGHHSKWAKKEKWAREHRSRDLNYRMLELSSKEINDKVSAEMTKIKLEMNLEANREKLF
ncbi:hypothetical protein EPI10_016906 [Gossypium australe]|uniref:Reverse transcriptase n=1 Tax=Gossypium australe TaxID=47621 RepID=A0A5B6VPY0_9ROSI|nr:hypothetical protein EPI10_016906 [Gossypium australe]